MMWREVIQNSSPDTGWLYGDPANQTEIDELENMLKVKLPADLKNCLLECNGIQDQYGLGLIWSANQISKNNLAMWNSSVWKKSHMSFDQLLFFADAGNGDQFAYSIIDGRVSHHIYAWNHEDDSRIWSAGGLKQYIEWWLQGKIRL